jgi:hypothetical protein
LRVDHVEISVARGTLTDEQSANLDRLLSDILGWRGETKEFVHPLDDVLRRERTSRSEPVRPCASSAWS